MRERDGLSPAQLKQSDKQSSQARRWLYLAAHNPKHRPIQLLTLHDTQGLVQSHTVNLVIEMDQSSPQGQGGIRNLREVSFNGKDESTSPPSKMLA